MESIMSATKTIETNSLPGAFTLTKEELRQAVAERLYNTVGSTRSLGWATAVWGGWRPVFSTRWPRWIPAVGYGIRYEYGIFRQEFHDGAQVEQPDEWLLLDYPWEFAQPDDMIPVGFGGHTEQRTDDKGRLEVRWRPAEQVMGEPHHCSSPAMARRRSTSCASGGRGRRASLTFSLFDIGDYASAVEHKVHSENISKVLYPNDNTPQGRELRCGSSTSSSPAPCATSCNASCAVATPSRPSPRRSSSSSTTPTRRRHP
jgi:hypothetical protein